MRQAEELAVVGEPDDIICGLPAISDKRENSAVGERDVHREQDETVDEDKNHGE